MRKLYNVLLTAACLLLSTIPSESAVFHFSYSGADIFGSGYFTTSEPYAGNTTTPYTVTSISGTAVWNNTASNIVGLVDYAGADQKLYFPASQTGLTGFEQPPTYVSIYGISFETSSGVWWNIANYMGPVIANSISNAGGSSLAQTYTLSDFSVELVGLPGQTPLPGALVMFSSALLLGGAALRALRRAPGVSSAVAT
jgi:hypothetical protein